MAVALLTTAFPRGMVVAEALILAKVLVLVIVLFQPQAMD